MRTAPGWTSIAIIVLTFGATQMFCLAIMGEYLGRTYMQTKQRPLFIIKSIHQGETPPPGANS
jgi:dolichol-phosphate mannosyltransferase